jgi:hypothetical protein
MCAIKSILDMLFAGLKTPPIEKSCLQSMTYPQINPNELEDKIDCNEISQMMCLKRLGVR